MFSPVFQGPPLTHEPAFPVAPERRFLGDLIVHELGRLRPQGLGAARLWLEAPETKLEAAGIDSLERLRLASAVAEAAGAAVPDHFSVLDTFSQWESEFERLRGAGDGSIGFRTSGSSGEPKLIRVSGEALSQEAAFLAQLFGGRRRVLSFVPACHIYGYFYTIALPRQLGIPVLDARRHSAASLPSLAAPGDLIVAHPPLWDAVAANPRDWPPDAAGVSSGGPLGPVVAERLARGGLALFDVLGSTETGGLAWRAGPGAPFRLFPYWRRLGEGALARSFGGHEQIFELPDEVEWLSESELTPLRRRDGAAQVAGVNVFPEKVRAVLLAHPAVKDARVRLMRPGEGDRLKAYIVPEPSAPAAQALREALEAWALERLLPPERPRNYAFGSALPAAPNGKPADWPIEGGEPASF